MITALCGLCGPDVGDTLKEGLTELGGRMSMAVRGILERGKCSQANSPLFQHIEIELKIF